MKKVLVRIVGCIITAALAIAGAMYMGHLLDPYDTEESMNAIEAFHSIEENSIDVCFYGTSHVWKGCDPVAFEEAYGMKAFNYGGNWQAMNTTLLFIRDSYRTQTPKVIFIDTYVVNFSIKNVDMDGQIYYTRKISNFSGKKEFLNDCFGDDWKKYITYYFPIAMFHDNWTSIEMENFSFESKSVNDYISSRGYDKSEDIDEVDLSECRNGFQRELSEEAIEILDNILKLSEEKGTIVIFYTCPYVGEYQYSEAMTSYASTHNCDYINLIDKIDEIGLDGATDFRDSQHLNDNGSKKVSLYLGKYLLDNYDIE